MITRTDVRTEAKIKTHHAHDNPLLELPAQGDDNASHRAPRDCDKVVGNQRHSSAFRPGTTFA